MSPRTPYTPFTGMRANPFDTLNVDAVPLLPEEDDQPLASLYNTILRFVQMNCTGVLELSEKINAKNRKTGRRPNAAAYSAESPQLASTSGSIAELGLNMQGFEIMANVIWAEIGRSIMEELGSVVFSAGNPSEFQKVRQFQNTPDVLLITYTFRTTPSQTISSPLWNISPHPFMQSK